MKQRVAGGNNNHAVTLLAQLWTQRQPHNHHCCYVM